MRSGAVIRQLDCGISIAVPTVCKFLEKLAGTCEAALVI